MRVLLVLPLVIPLATGVVALLLRRLRGMQRAASVLGAGGLLAATVAILGPVRAEGVVAAQMGGWAAPFGITLAADALSAGLLVATALVLLAVIVYAVSGMDPERERFGFYPLTFLMVLGVNGAFITGDLFNLYVWFEVLLIASFVLLVLGNERLQLDGAIKYVGINLISSVSFLVALGLFYGQTGTLNMADAAGKVQAAGLSGTPMEAALVSLFIVAFGIKAGIFPLFFWLPASYHTPPAPVAAVFAGLLTKVGLYAMVRVFPLVFGAPAGYTQVVLLGAAGLTMIAGVLGALVERDVQRLLAFLVVSAMGYVLMGLAFYTELGLTGTVFYMLQDVVVKGALFLLAGLMQQATGARRLGQMGGLYLKRPFLALLFFTPFFSLAGFPPFPGFWGKLTLLQAGFAAGQGELVAIALAVGLVTLLVVAQVFSVAFWRDAPVEKTEAASAPATTQHWATTRWATTAPVAALVLVLFALGLWAQPLYDLSAQAAAGLMNPDGYIQAVLGG
jgi:multicomponent Na+:H+ antiporter subunit D